MACKVFLMLLIQQCSKVLYFFLDTTLLQISKRRTCIDFLIPNCNGKLMQDHADIKLLFNLLPWLKVMKPESFINFLDLMLADMSGGNKWFLFVRKLVCSYRTYVRQTNATQKLSEVPLQSLRDSAVALTNEFRKCVRKVGRSRNVINCQNFCLKSGRFNANAP